MVSNQELHLSLTSRRMFFVDISLCAAMGETVRMNQSNTLGDVRHIV